MFKVAVCVFVACLVCFIEAKPASDYTYTVKQIPYQIASDPIPIPVPNLPVSAPKSHDLGGEVQVGPGKVNAALGLGPDGPHANVGLGIANHQIGVDLNPGKFIKDVFGVLTHG